MSQIKLKHSGGNSVIIAAPSSNPASDRTITLPDLTADATLSTIDGVSVLDTYMLNATTTFGNDTQFQMDSGFVRASTLLSTTGNIGTGVTKSGQYFSFPSTGIYQIVWRPILAVTNGSASRYSAARIYATTNNSSYSQVAEGNGSSPAMNDSSFCYSAPIAKYHFDVTNTSTHKVYFEYINDQSGSIIGGSTIVFTYATFIKIGET
tara:strand:+ start:151 stop:771 length:621 start_codon:yes stop_codon:yes gene_type:complete